MAAYIQRPDNSFIFFDLTDEEDLGRDTKITEYPVEEGADLTDHARPMPETFTLDVTVTNTPLFGDVYGGSQQAVSIPINKYKAPFAPTPGAVTGAIEDAVSSLVSSLTGGDPTSYNASVLKFDTPFDAVTDVMAALDAVHDNSELLQVVTSKKAFKDVMLESHRVVRNAGTGTGAVLRLTFKQIKKIQVKAGNTPAPTEPRGKAPVQSKGKKNTKPADPAQIKAVDAVFADDGLAGVKQALKGLVQ